MFEWFKRRADRGTVVVASLRRRTDGRLRKLPEDVEFINAMKLVTRTTGLMQKPEFDAATCQLTEADLRLDLLNVWHTSHQLCRPDTDAIVETWLRPKNLKNACYYGRVDVVQRVLGAGMAPTNKDEGDPIAAAIGAWVVTPLHVRCVELLFSAGAEATFVQFDEYAVESVGSPEDRAILRLLLAAAERSTDPLVRARAQK